VDLTLDPGELVAIVGANGSGKSTLVSLLAGALEPTKGMVLVEGAPLSPSHQEQVGALFERGISLEPTWSPIAYLRHLARLYTVSTEDAIDRARTWLETLSATGWESHSIGAMSKGNRRKVEIVRSVLHDPDVLIWDEPTKDLDRAARDRLWNRVQELTSRGTAAIVVSHRLDASSEIADRVIALQGGEITWKGEPESVSSLPAWMVEVTR
jgi:ABC-type multidrug transport system ATPase subunit